MAKGKTASAADAIIVLPAGLRSIAPMRADDSPRPDMNGVHLMVTDDGFVAQATNGKMAAILKGTMPTRPVERFPDVAAVVPKGKPVAVLDVDAAMLAQLLMSAEEVSPHGIVRLEFHGQSTPLVVRAKHKDDAEFTGLLMPCEIGSSYRETSESHGPERSQRGIEP